MGRKAGRAKTFVCTDPKNASDSGKIGKFTPTCVVCLAEFEIGEKLAELPCGHVFHTRCVAEWLACKSGCPYRCVGEVLPPEDEDLAVPSAKEKSTISDIAQELTADGMNAVPRSPISSFNLGVLRDNSVRISD